RAADLIARYCLSPLCLITQHSVLSTLLHHHVDQFSRNDDYFRDRAPVDSRFDFAIRKRKLLQLIIARTDIRKHAPAQLTVDLNSNLEFVLACQLFAVLGPRLVRQTMLVPAVLPQLLRNVRRERSEHAYQRLYCFLCNKDICFRRPSRGVNRLIERVDLVRQLHQARHTSIQMKAFVKVLRDGTDDLMRSSAQRALMFDRLARGNRPLVRGYPAVPLVNNSPNALQISCGAFEAGVRPLLILLRRTREQYKQPQRIGALTVDHLNRIHRVLLRLGHLFDGADHYLLTAQQTGLVFGDLLWKQPAVVIAPERLLQNHS